MSPPINLVQSSSIVDSGIPFSLDVDDDKYISNLKSIKKTESLAEDDMIGIGSLSSNGSSLEPVENCNQSQADTGIDSEMLSNLSISPSRVQSSDRNNSISSTSDDMSDFELGNAEDFANCNTQNMTVVNRSGSDDLNDEENTNRRDTLILAAKNDSDNEMETKFEDTKTENFENLAAKNIHHECASLSSLYSSYSQFDFVSRSIPSPPPHDQNFSKNEAQSSLSSFLGIFGSKKSQSKLDLLTSKFFGFKSKTDAPKNQIKSLSSADFFDNSSESRIINQINSSCQDLKIPDSMLIFENRPGNLPAKSYEEELKHRQEYERMVEMAKKKEQKEKEIKLKKQKQLNKKEDFMTNSLKVWNNEILVDWEEQKLSKRTCQLWWHGLPPSIRGKVWKLAIGNELCLTNESYYFYDRKARQKLELMKKYDSPDDEKSHESSVELIKLDVSRTFPHLSFFQKDGPYHDALHNVLGAYACYNSQIGYVQGMSFLTAILLLNMEDVDAFICLANLLNTNVLMACFCMDQSKMKRYFRVHQILFEYNIPRLYKHFEDQNAKPDLYLIDWIFTLFSKSLPLDVMSRVWDVFFRDKEEFLFRTALGILNLYKDTLMEMDFIHIVQFLTKLPENINSTHLFKSIDQIVMCIDDISFENLVHYDS